MKQAAFSCTSCCVIAGSHSVSQLGLSGQGRYLLAQCCHNLGKYDEAKTTLMHDSKGEVNVTRQPFVHQLAWPADMTSIYDI